MARQTCIIDRFEDNKIAVLEQEDGSTLDVPAEWIPEGAKEGDVLSFEPPIDSMSERLHFFIEAEATAQRLAYAKRLRASLTQAPEGDIEL